MDPVVQIVLALIAITVFYRIRLAFRKAKMGNKAERINAKLAELRKKRDEE